MTVAAHHRVEAAEYRARVQRDAHLARGRQAGGGPVDFAHPLEEPQRELRAVARRLEYRVQRIAPGLRLERPARRRLDQRRAEFEEALLEQRRRRVVQAAVAGEVREEHRLQRAPRPGAGIRQRRLARAARRSVRRRCARRPPRSFACDRVLAAAGGRVHPIDHRSRAQLAQVDHPGRADVPVPARERGARAADPHGLAFVDDAEQRRRRLQLRRAQHREALHQHRRMLEQHVVAEVALVRRHDDARRGGARGGEARQPFLAARGHAGAHEIALVERQHEVDFRAPLERGVDEQQVRAAGGGREDDRRVQIGKRLANRRAHRGDCGRRKPGNAPVGGVDHVPGERDHVGGAQQPQDVDRVRQRPGEQAHLPPHRRDDAGVVGGASVRGRVALRRAFGVAEQQARLALGREIPDGARRHCARRETRVDLAGKPPCGSAIAEEHRQRRGVDARVRVFRERVGPQVLVARVLGLARRARSVGRAVERLLPQVAAQAQDVGQARGRGCGPRLRLVEQRVRRMGGAGAGVRERAPVQQLRVGGVQRDCLVERVAPVPGRALIEMAADALAGVAGKRRAGGIARASLRTIHAESGCRANASEPRTAATIQRPFRCSSTIQLRQRSTLTRRRIAGGRRSMIAVASVSCDALPPGVASADA